MTPLGLRTLAGLAAVAGTSAFLQPLSLLSTRVVPQPMSSPSCSRSHGIRMTVRYVLRCALVQPESCEWLVLDFACNFGDSVGRSIAFSAELNRVLQLARAV